MCPGSLPSANPLFAQVTQGWMPLCPFPSNLWAGREFGVLPHRPLWLSAGYFSTKGSSWTLSGPSAPCVICLLPCLNTPWVTPLPELKEIFSAASLTPTEYSRSFLQIFPSSSLWGNSGIQKYTLICLGPGFFKKCGHMQVHHRRVSPAALWEHPRGSVQEREFAGSE